MEETKESLLLDPVELGQSCNPCCHHRWCRSWSETIERQESRTVAGLKYARRLPRPRWLPGYLGVPNETYERLFRMCAKTRRSARRPVAMLPIPRGSVVDVGNLDFCHIRRGSRFKCRECTKPSDCDGRKPIRPGLQPPTACVDKISYQRLLSVQLYIHKDDNPQFQRKDGKMRVPKYGAHRHILCEQHHILSLKSSVRS